jgi:hypothetical protein
MDNVYYQIDEVSTVRAWIGDQTEPFLLQPQYPDGTPFETKEKAEEWAARWYAHFTSPESNPDFPISPISSEEE